MKNKVPKPIIWIGLFIIFIVVGALIYRLKGALILGLIYLILNCVLFWGKASGIIAYICHLVFKKPTIAEKFYKIAVNQKSTTTTALVSYGMLLLRRGELDYALNLFDRAEKQANDNIIMLKSTLTNKALCYWQKGDIDKAIEILLNCTQRFEYLNPDIYETLGYFYILKNDYDKALEYTNKALSDNPNHASSLDNMGQIYYRLNDYDKALSYFEKAISIKDNLADSYYYLGLIAEKQDNTAKASDYFKKASLCKINSFNTITKEQVEQKYNQYFGENH